jgi:hypothetical protein
MPKTIKINLSEKIRVLELIGLRKASSKPFSKKHKFDSETIVGERIGRDGKVAYVHQIVDRTKNYYKKYVKQGKKIIKDVECKLTDHK